MCIPVDIDLRQAAGRFEHARHVENLAPKILHWGSSSLGEGTI
jgi:hypothetical protein